MKIGLSLGGGGAKGAYQVGVLQALEEYNLINCITMYSGVSIGAINAYFYLSSQKSKTVYDAWIYGINNNPFKEEHPLQRNKESGGFYNLDILKTMAEEFLDKQTFKKLNKDLYVVLTKVKEPSLVKLVLKSNREKVIVHVNKKEEPLDFVISSASIPVVFGFQKLGDSYYVDGGISDNNPIDVLVEKGAEIIFHSSFQQPIDFNKYKDKNIVLIELTSMHAMPSLRITRFLSSVAFDERLFEKGVKYGYYVTKSMIEYLKESKILFIENNKYIFKNPKKGFINITIPFEIHDEVKKMHKNK